MRCPKGHKYTEFMCGSSHWSAYCSVCNTIYEDYDHDEEIEYDVICGRYGRWMKKL